MRPGLLRVSWSRAFLPSDPDLTFSSLIQRRLGSTHLLLAQALLSSTYHPYRSSLGIEILNSNIQRTNPGDGKFGQFLVQVGHFISLSLSQSDFYPFQSCLK